MTDATTSTTGGAPRLPKRDASGHKGTFGTVVVVGGCCHRQVDGDDPVRPSMLGGPCFSAMAALRSGCGLAKLVTPEPLVAPALTIAPSATAFGMPVDEETGDIVPHRAAAVIDTALRGASAAVIGPGLGVSRGSIAATLRIVGHPDVPVIVDADGLNCLAEVEDVAPDMHAPMILTPHPGEFARVAKAVGVSAIADDTPSRVAGAEQLARRLGCVVVLKSEATVVTDGHATWVHDRPNPVLATAGTGDVLSGIIAGVVAQHVRPHVAMGSMTKASQHRGGISLWDAARVGISIHAEAASLWREGAEATGGMTAMELIDLVVEAAEAHRE